MHLSGRFLIIVIGPTASRREDIVGLLAGGAAYLSTLTEIRGAHVHEDATEGVQVVTGAQPASHTSIVRLSPEDAFVNETVEERSINMPDVKSQDSEEWIHAVGDFERRIRVAMFKGISIILAHGPEHTPLESLYSQAHVNGYEVIRIAVPEPREGVLWKLRRQKRTGILPRFLIDPVPPGYNVFPMVKEEDGFVNPRPERTTLTTADIAAPVTVDEGEVEAPPTPKQQWGVRIASVDQALEKSQLLFFSRILNIGMAAPRNIIRRMLAGDTNVSSTVLPLVKDFDPRPLQAKYLKQASEVGLDIEFVPLTHEKA